MQDLHWRYNFNTEHFDFVENNPQQHYEPLLKHVHVPTLVIDINLVQSKTLQQYITDVVDKALAANIKYRQIIFDGTQDPVADYKAKTTILNEFSKNKSIRCFFALSQFDLQTHSHLKEINYPSWLFVFKKQPRQEFSDHRRKFSFSCLNRNPTFHRLVFYSMLKERGLLDKFIYSFYDRCPYQGHPVQTQQYRGLENLVGESLAQACYENIKDFPISYQGEALGENDHSVNHPAYTDAWCNVVTETSALYSFTSEKIWKPIASGQLFLVVGAYGTNAWLKKLGFHTFEDQYDLKPILSSRLNCVANIVNNHKDDAEDWWHSNRFQIEQNYYWFHSGNVERQLLDPLISQLNNF